MYFNRFRLYLYYLENISVDGCKFPMFMHWLKFLKLRVEMKPNLEAFKMKSDLYIFKDSD